MVWLTWPRPSLLSERVQGCGRPSAEPALVRDAVRERASRVMLAEGTVDRDGHEACEGWSGEEGVTQQSAYRTRTPRQRLIQAGALPSPPSAKAKACSTNSARCGPHSCQNSVGVVGLGRSAEEGTGVQEDEIPQSSYCPHLVPPKEVLGLAVRDTLEAGLLWTCPPETPELRGVQGLWRKQHPVPSRSKTQPGCSRRGRGGPGHAVGGHGATCSSTQPPVLQMRN